MTTLSIANQSLDGDLSSIFGRQPRNTQNPTSSHEWNLPNGTQEDLYREYPNSLSPQSPFDYSENQLLGNRSQQGKPDSHHAYSSLRPPSPSPYSQLTYLNQGSLLPLDSLSLLQAISPINGGQKLARESMYRPTNERRGNRYSLQGVSDGLDGVLRSMHQQSNSDQQQFVVNFLPPQPTHSAAQSSSWNNNIGCKVDLLATELESEIMEPALRPGQGQGLQGLQNFQQGMGNAQMQNVLYTAQDNDAVWRGMNWTGNNLQNGYVTQLHQQQQHPTSGASGMLRALETGGASGMVHHNPALGATGLQLVHLLLACAEAVANEQMDLAHVILVRLSSLVVPRGNTMQRLAAVFVDALAARVTHSNSSGPYQGLARDRSVPVSDLLESFSVLYDCTPLGKFAHLTLNQVLLDAVERESSIHVIDLELWHGMQWPAFLQALALRPGGPPRVRISTVGSSAKDLEVSREKLQDCANNLRVPFEFCPIVEKLENFHVGLLDMREGETVVVNAFIQFHRLLTKGNEKFHEFLKDLRALKPRVLAMAENDGEHNSPAFLHRFVECLRYYSAIFDAFDASLPPGSPSLLKVEQYFAGQKIRNIIACEGPARVERHESMSSWARRMEAAGFRSVPIGTRAISQAKLLLTLYYHSGYTLTAEHGHIVVGWYNMGLLGVAAWQ